VHCYLPGGVVLENLFQSLGVVTIGHSCCCKSFDYFGGDFVLFFLLLFWLCAFLVSRLDLDIMLLQRLGVLIIILVLRYSLYQKKL
jgi:hypothetical protein